MKPRALVLSLLLLAVGFAAGWFANDRKRESVAPPDAKTALADLLGYHGTGAPASRRVIDWVDEIAAGGPAMLPALSDALETAPDRKYTEGAWQLDPGRGILSTLPTLRAALAEAVSKIGGDDAIPILIREANRQGAWPRSWVDRWVAFALMKRHDDREDVREYYEQRIRALLRSKQDDTEAFDLMVTARHSLPTAIWDDLVLAFKAGWAGRNLMDEIAATLASLDEDAAGRLFLAVVADGSAPGSSRDAAARALGRLPSFRPEAVTRILALGEKNGSFVLWFVEGMRHGRFEEQERERAARESLDLETMLAYIRARKDDLEAMLGHLATLEAGISPEVAKTLRFPGWREEFEKIRRFAEEREKQLVAEMEKRGKS